MQSPSSGTPGSEHGQYLCTNRVSNSKPRLPKDTASWPPTPPQTQSPTDWWRPVPAKGDLEDLWDSYSNVQILTQALEKFSTHSWQKLSKNPVQKAVPPWNKKSHMWWSHSRYHTQWWKADSSFSKTRNKTRMPTSLLLCNIVLEVLARAIRQEQEARGIQIGKEELCLQMAWSYRENSKDSTKTQLKLIRECNKVAGYKINIQKSGVSCWWECKLV